MTHQNGFWGEKADISVITNIVLEQLKDVCLAQRHSLTFTHSEVIETVLIPDTNLLVSVAFRLQPLPF